MRGPNDANTVTLINHIWSPFRYTFAHFLLIDFGDAFWVLIFSDVLWRLIPLYLVILLGIVIFIALLPLGLSFLYLIDIGYIYWW